jgi:hypothetical protein
MHSHIEVYSSAFFKLPIPVAALSKAWVCGHPLDGVAGSNPTGGIDVHLL